MAVPDFLATCFITTSPYRANFSAGARCPGFTVLLLTKKGPRSLRRAECGGPVHSVKPWQMEGMLGKPMGRRGNVNGKMPLSTLDAAC